MRAVIQRVTEASVTIDGEVVGKIGQGFLVLIGVEEGDGENDFKYMSTKVPNLRIFEDENGKMNRSLLDVGGQILAVSQFTLLGDARSSRRPSLPRLRVPKRPIRCMNVWWQRGANRASMWKRVVLAQI